MPGLGLTRLRFRVALGLVVSTAIVLAPAAAGTQPKTLRAKDAALAAQSRAAVLGLYATETQLATARERLGDVRARVEAVRRQRRLATLQLGTARRGLAISQGRLALRIRALYERGDPDPIAVVLSSQSLDAAVAGIESLGQMARGDRTVVEQLRGARRSLRALERRLADRERRLDRLVAAAERTERGLEAARAERAAYVERLASERRLTHAAIARAERVAHAAHVKARTFRAAAPAPAGAAAPAVAVRTAMDAGETQLAVDAVAYSLPGSTALGIPVGWGVAAVDPAVIPLGTRFTVPGYGEAIAADVGTAVHGAVIDLWFPSLAQARAWGRRSVTIVLR
jgi:3D (Asp-Asp-Asp) domain-containing protein